MEKCTGRKIKVLHSDNKGEYISDSFLQLCRDEGIERHFTVRKIPQQNGVAERMNMTFPEKVQCMLSTAGISKYFWAEAAYACYLVSRLTLYVIGGKTPLEAWSGRVAQDYDLLGDLGVRPTIMSRKTNRTQERRKMCS